MLHSIPWKPHTEKLHSCETLTYSLELQNTGFFKTFCEVKHKSYLKKTELKTKQQLTLRIKKTEWHFVFQKQQTRRKKNNNKGIRTIRCGQITEDFLKPKAGLQQSI